MGKRYQDPKTPREVRRQTEQMIHAVLRGSDTWEFGLLEWVCVIAFIIIVVLADNQARGDLIIEVDYLDTTVYHESEALVDKVGIGLSGKGRSLGWLVFWQPETFWGVGPAVEFGGWSERYGGLTQQSLQFYADSDGYLRTGLYGDRITGDVGALVAGGYLRPDTQIPIGHAAVYLPFVWSSHADQFGDDEPDTVFSGTGWISFTAFDQTPPAGQPASFHVGEVLLTTANSYAGQRVFLQAVPEPATWGVFVAVCCAVVLYKRGRR
jgi:hypothetical protein